MKMNRSKNKSHNGSHTHRIHFEFTAPTAETVAIAGTFNDWRPNATPMVVLDRGRWMKDLSLPPGIYEYRLVVDGRWMPDPHAKNVALNPFGGMNSVCRVGKGP